MKSRWSSLLSLGTSLLPRTAAGKLFTCAAPIAAVAAYVAYDKLHVDDDGSRSSGSNFERYQVIDAQDVTPDVRVLRMRSLEYKNNNAKFVPLCAQVTNFAPFSMNVVNPRLSVVRPYTPIFWSLFSTEPRPRKHLLDGDGKLEEMDVEVTLCVKKYKHGNTSEYLYGLRPGHIAQLSGPHVSSSVNVWGPHPADTPAHLVFIAGGTGIAPFLQMPLLCAGNTLGLPGEKSCFRRMTLIYAAENPGGHIFRKNLEAMAHRSGESLDAHFITGPIGADTLSKIMPPAETPGLKVVVCGPDGMIEALAGPRDPTSQAGQGKFGGMLAALGYSSEQVSKLLD